MLKDFRYQRILSELDEMQYYKKTNRHMKEQEVKTYGNL